MMSSPISGNELFCTEQMYSHSNTVTTNWTLKNTMLMQEHVGIFTVEALQCGYSYCTYSLFLFSNKPQLKNEASGNPCSYTTLVLCVQEHPIYIVLVLCDFILRDFALTLLENLHHFWNLCDNFWINAIWYRRSMDMLIFCRRLAGSDVTVIPSVDYVGDTTMWLI
jgi:hypothetical protein